MTSEPGPETPRPAPCPRAAQSVSCQHCVDFLLDYIDGQLAEDERFKFESHIAFCRDCEVFLENYREACRLTSRLQPAETEGVDAGSGRGDCSAAGRLEDVPESLIQAILRARRHDH